MPATRHKPAALGAAPRFAEPVYVTRPRLPDHRAFSELTARIFENKWLTNDGEFVRRLENELRLRLETGFCATVCNGTVGLLIALRSLNLRGEVITTPFTFPATVHAIQYCGLTPVFCDIDPDTYNMSAELTAALVSENTSALLPVHVFGNPCDVLGLQRLAQDRDIPIVYDAAHAFGVSHRGRGIGCWGDLSVFSFHATKLFHTAEGGAIVGADPDRLAGIASLRNFGIINEDEVRGVGINGKLSELHAALGLLVLERFDEEVRARGERVALYRQSLAGVEGIKLQRIEPETIPNHAYFPIEIDAESFGLSRDQLHLAMRAENIITRKYFHPLCSDNPAYRSLPSARPDCLPNAYRLASRVLCLPLYGELPLDTAEAIAGCLLAIRESAPAIRSSDARGRR
jgi:dTDP-4-amino-4,6-dideoxygalactose transaminase